MLHNLSLCDLCNCLVLIDICNHDIIFIESSDANDDLCSAILVVLLDISCSFV